MLFYLKTFYKLLVTKYGLIVFGRPDLQLNLHQSARKFLLVAYRKNYNKTYFRPLFRDNIKKIIFNIALNNNFIFTSYGRTTRKSGAEKFRCHFQVNIFNTKIFLLNWVDVKIVFCLSPKVLKPVTTVTDFFFPLGALDTHTCFGASSFFFAFIMPLPPRFWRFFSSSAPPSLASSLIFTFSNSDGKFRSNHCLHLSYSG